MNYGYGPQEMDTAQNLVVRAGRRADPPIYDAYGSDVYIIPFLTNFVDSGLIGISNFPYKEILNIPRSTFKFGVHNCTIER